MKRIILGIATVFTSVGMLSAQNDCMILFPQTKGATLVNKQYDAQNNHISTSTYTVTDSYDYMSGASANIAVSLTDYQDRSIDQGKLETRCDDGNFYMRLETTANNPNIMKLLAGNTELVGSYLNYPNIFGNNFLNNTNFDMEPGEFTVKSKEDGDNYIRVNVYNRRYEKSENITTPAGNFDASKVSFNYDVYNHKDKTTTKFKGIEWLSSGAGVVRSETYDENDNLLNYTVLSTMMTDI